MIRLLCADIGTAEESLYGEVYRRLYGQATRERQARADRYRRFDDKLRCVTADALLRRAMGTADYRIEKKPLGKPYVMGRNQTYYNLSHSGRYVVLALGETDVGVDVQQHSETIDRVAVAGQSFAPKEQAYAGQSIRSFFDVWTGKESYLKYTGEGLRRDMRSFSIVDEDLPDGLQILCLSCLPDEDYSLSLCTTDTIYSFELTDVRQL